MKTEYLILASILGWGAGSLFYKLANDNMHPIMVSTIITAVYVIVTPFAFLFLKFDTSLNALGVLWAALGAIAMCVGSMGYFYALKAGGGAGEITTLTSLYPALTLLLSWLFLGEALTLRKTIGITLAFASIVVFSWK